MFEFLSLITAVFVTYFIIKILGTYAVKVGFVDIPDKRKLHEGHIPPIGGVAMLFGILSSTFFIPELSSKYLSLYVAMSLLVCVGVYDDVFNLSPFRKFIWQITAALFITSWGGVYITNLGDLAGFGNINLDDWSIPFTVICIIGVINAINMSDGVDGLAAGFMTVTVTFMLIASFMSSNEGDGLLLFATIGILVGFLIFNIRTPWRNRAAVFMGDSGSMMLGLLITWFCIEFTQSTEKPIFSPITAVYFIGMPLLDMGSVMFSRMVSGKGPFSADREHMHHIMLRKGFSVNETVIILLLSSVILSLVGLLGLYSGVADSIMFYLFLSILAVYYFIRQYVAKMISRSERIEFNS